MLHQNILKTPIFNSAYNRPTKNLFIIHGLPIGGAEKFLIGLLNYYDKQDFQVHLLLLSDQDYLLKDVCKGVYVYKILKNYRFDLSISYQIKDVIDSISPDNIMCINTYSFFLTKMALLFNKHYKVILSPHTTKPFSFYNYLQNLIYFRLLTKTDVIVYLCNAQMLYLNKKYKLGLHEKRVIYNGIDTDYFSPTHVNNDAAEVIKRDLAIMPEDKVIVQVARIQSEKRHQDSILALKNLRRINNHQKVHLIFVGGGKEQYIEELKSIAKSNEILSNIHFVGPQDDVRIYYKLANIFTLTSESETFSLAALEAMSFGIPVVMTDVGGAKEMVSAFKNGILVPVKNPTALADAWNQALHFQFNSSMIRNQVIQKYSVSAMYTHYDQVLLKGSKRITDL